jgi:hypothetical protein
MYAVTARYLVDCRQHDLQAEAAAERLARRARRRRAVGAVGFAAAVRQLVVALFAAA